MAFSLGSWRPRQLFISWGAYWLVLLATVMRPALVSALRATAAPHGHGSISAGMTNSVLTLSVKSDGLAYTGSASLLTIALWIAGPPLLLWAIWVATRARPATAARERIS